MFGSKIRAQIDPEPSRSLYIMSYLFQEIPGVFTGAPMSCVNVSTFLHTMAYSFFFLLSLFRKVVYGATCKNLLIINVKLLESSFISPLNGARVTKCKKKYIYGLSNRVEDVGCTHEKLGNFSLLMRNIFRWRQCDGEGQYGPRWKNEACCRRWKSQCRGIQRWGSAVSGLHINPLSWTELYPPRCQPLLTQRFRVERMEWPGCSPDS